MPSRELRSKRVVSERALIEKGRCVQLYHVVAELNFTSNFMCVLQAVLQTGGQLELEVRPLFLVPDTNGFIDHLGGLKKLLQCGTYIIVVPLIGKTRNKVKG